MNERAPRADRRSERTPKDAMSVLLPGPWEHRFVAANGARFHVAELGSGPLVLLLHGFPQFWWAWRHQLSALAESGYRAVAMDLRGYGASDKPPQGNDAITMAADVAGVIRCLGENRGVVVGAGLGGWLSWSMPTLHRELIRAIGVIGSAHPVVMARAPIAHPSLALVSRSLCDMRTRYVTEHRLERDPGCVKRLLHRWAAPDAGWPSSEEAGVYAAAMAVPFAAHSALESHQWLARSPLGVDGLRYLQRLGEGIQVPVLQIQGTSDRAVAPRLAARSDRFVSGSYHWVSLPGCGHFAHEEAPTQVSGLLLDWLAALPT